MEGNWNGALGQNKYQLTGMEWQDDFGLGWSHHNARFYDPAVARWWAVDALAEAYVSYSPYNYVMGQVTTTIDPSGMAGQGADGLNTEEWLRATNPAHRGSHPSSMAYNGLTTANATYTKMQAQAEYRSRTGANRPVTSDDIEYSVTGAFDYYQKDWYQKNDGENDNDKSDDMYLGTTYFMRVKQVQQVAPVIFTNQNLVCSSSFVFENTTGSKGSTFNAGITGFRLRFNNFTGDIYSNGFVAETSPNANKPAEAAANALNSAFKTVQLQIDMGLITTGQAASNQFYIEASCVFHTIINSTAPHHVQLMGQFIKVGARTGTNSYQSAYGTKFRPLILSSSVNPCR